MSRYTQPSKKRKARAFLSKILDSITNQGDVLRDESAVFSLSTAALVEIVLAFSDLAEVDAQNILSPSTDSNESATQNRFVRFKTDESIDQNVMQAASLRNLFARVFHLKLHHCMETIRGELSLLYFPALQTINIHKVPVHLIRGLQRLRPQLSVLSYYGQLTLVEDLIGLCGGDRSEHMNWNSLTTLCINFAGLDCLDDSLNLLPKLEHLDLSYNSLRAVPELECLSHLRSLNLGFNRLIYVPRLCSTARHSLNQLILRNNNLDNLDGIENLTSLEVLDLQANCICDHERLNPLSNLSHLSYISFVDNPICYDEQHRLLTLARLSSDLIRSFALRGPSVLLGGTNTSAKSLIIDGRPLSQADTELLRKSSLLSGSSGQTSVLASSVASRLRLRPLHPLPRDQTPVPSELTDDDHDADTIVQVERRTPRKRLPTREIRLSNEADVVVESPPACGLDDSVEHQVEVLIHNSGQEEVLNTDVESVVSDSAAFNTELTEHGDTNLDVQVPVHLPETRFEDTSEKIIEPSPVSPAVHEQYSSLNETVEESEPFIVVPLLPTEHYPAGSAIFITLTDRYLFEKNEQGQQVESLDLRCLIDFSMSNETPQEFLTHIQDEDDALRDFSGPLVCLQFDHIKPDRQRRRYVTDDLDAAYQLEALLRPLVDRKLVNDMLDSATSAACHCSCLKCGCEFTSEVQHQDEQRGKSPELICPKPKCRSNMVIRLDRIENLQVNKATAAPQSKEESQNEETLPSSRFLSVTPNASTRSLSNLTDDEKSSKFGATVSAGETFAPSSYSEHLSKFSAANSRSTAYYSFPDDGDDDTTDDADADNSSFFLGTSPPDNEMKTIPDYTTSTPIQPQHIGRDSRTETPVVCNCASSTICPLHSSIDIRLLSTEKDEQLKDESNKTPGTFLPRNLSGAFLDALQSQTALSKPESPLVSSSFDLDTFFGPRADETVKEQRRKESSYYSSTDFEKIDHRLKLHLHMNLFDDSEQFRCILRCSVTKYMKARSFEGLLIMSTTKLYILSLPTNESENFCEWLQVIDRQPIAQLRNVDIGLSYQSIRLEFDTKGSCYTLVVGDETRCKTFLAVFTTFLQSRSSLTSHLSSVSKDCQVHSMENLRSALVNVHEFFDGINWPPDKFFFVSGYLEKPDRKGNVEVSLVSFVLSSSGICCLKENYQWPLPRLQDPIEEPLRDRQFRLLHTHSIEQISHVTLFDQDLTKCKIHFISEDNVNYKEKWTVTMETKNSLHQLLNNVKLNWEKQFGIDLDFYILRGTGLHVLE